jgi:hypothetical protein
MSDPEKKLHPGILNFWRKKEEPVEEEEVRSGYDTYMYRGQRYQLVIDASNKDRADGAIGALIAAILTDPKAKAIFAKQSIYTNAPLGPVTELQFGDDITLYGKAGSLNAELGIKMLIDRLVFALSECRRNPEVEQMLKTVGLRTVTIVT